MKDLLVCGINGKNGSLVAKYAKRFGFNLSCGVDLNNFCEADCPVYKSFSEVKQNADFLIDFSSPKLTEEALDFAKKYSVKTVIATTGLTDDLLKKAKLISRETPVCISSNFSKSMQSFTLAAQKLKEYLPDLDAAITEIHRKNKKDCPSGTALALSEATGVKNVISLRAGDECGEHNFILFGDGERIELKHSVYDRGVFARGALEAAAFLSDKQSGFFTASQAFGI